jgi:hypothetical protein
MNFYAYSNIVQIVDFVHKVTSISTRISWWHQFLQEPLGTQYVEIDVILNTLLEHLHLHSVPVNPTKHISHIQVLVTDFFPTPPIKLKLGLQVGGRLVIATHWDQSNYLGNQKHGATHRYDLSVFITPLPGILHGYVVCYRVPAFLVWIYSWTSSKSHILSIGGDAITKTPITKTPIRKPQSRQIEFSFAECTMVMPIPPKNAASLVRWTIIRLNGNGFYQGLFHNITSFVVDDSNFKHES